MKVFYLCFVLIYAPLITLLAQVHTQQGTIQIEENSVISVQGNFTNKATITNQGKLVLYNDWSNQGKYVPATGTILLNGKQKQTFNHNKQAVTNLQIDNSNLIHFPSDIFIDNTLVLEKGHVSPESNAFFVLNENATIIGGSSEAFVNGALYRTGVGEKFYPIGKAGVYAPTTLKNIKGDNPVVGMEFYTDRSLSNRGEDIQLLSNNAWKQTLLSGTYTGSEVELSTINNQDFQLDQERLVVTGSNEKNGLFQNFGLASIQFNNNRYSISSYLPVTSTYITVGLLLIDTRKLYIPNTFSLQASNLEDQAIKIYGNQLATEDFYMMIQDTWGNVVFETKSLTLATTQGWNGNNIKTDHREHANIFRYLVKGRFTNGESFKRTGTILLY